MNCPSCGLPDWMIQTAPADVYCVHCGSTFHLLRSRAESIAKKQQLIEKRGRENVAQWLLENNGARRGEP